MEHRLWDLLYFILQEIIEEEMDFHQDNTAIREHLQAAGYEEEEIDTAFGWLETYFRALPQKPDVPVPVAGASPQRSLRVLSFDEKMLIAPEAHGFLHGLESRGVIGSDTAEEIIHRSMNMFDDLVGIEEMKMVALLTMFEQGHNSLEDLLKMVNAPDLKSIH